jgi:nucleoside-diphosphate-sugar epimerase
MTSPVRRQGKLEGLKVLVTGATGAVATPIVRALSPDNDVHALARLRTPADAQKLEGSGATLVPFDLATGSFDDLDEDYDLVLNFAVRRSADDDFEQEMVTGAEALGLLMQRCRGARTSSIAPRPPSTAPRVIIRPTKRIRSVTTTGPSCPPIASGKSSPKEWPAAPLAPTASRR